MALTKDQALTSHEFHQTGGSDGRPCDSKKGPVRWRRNGATKTWKRRPEEYSIPVKFGLYSYGYITPDSALTFDIHAAEDCPVEMWRR